MRRRELIVLVVGVVMIGAAAATLLHFKARQRLGAPGIKTSAREGSIRLNIHLPTNAPGFVAEVVDSTAIEEALPSDTSIATVSYQEPGQPPVQATAVLMGTDRTSIHNPELCLPGGGWNIDHDRSGLEVVHITRPDSVDLPVMRIHTTRIAQMNGQSVTLSGIYVYWFVTDGAVEAERWKWMSLMAETLLREGVLQRWAYLSYFTYCLPGQEDQAFNRIKQAMNATVPEFQLAWPNPTQAAGIQP